jgi:DNA repair exonuclease SbcCD ATPase subunit
MLQKARKKINSIETDRTIYSSNIKNLESFIVSLKKQITDTENSIKDFDQKKDEELVTLNSRKESLLIQISEINSAVETLEEKIKEIKLDETDYSTKQINLNTAIKTDENSIKEKKSQIKFLDKGDVCPLCSNEITEEHKQKELLKLNSSISDLEKKIDGNKKKLVSIIEKVSEQKKTKTLFDNSKNDLNLAKMKVSNFQRTISDIDLQIKSVSSRELNLDVSSIKDDYEKKVETYKNDSKELTRLNKEHFNYKIVSKMLAEDGIKSFFFKMLVPILNAKINEYLNLFDLPVNISFDETMKDTISAIGTNEKDISYMAFSEGEKKRIDIAILLSFIGVTKSISNWNCNILVFDEILDSATDIDGLEKLLTSIKEMSTNDPKLCSYVISHRDAFQDIYTGIVRIHKVGGFSKIEIST